MTQPVRPPQCPLERSPIAELLAIAAPSVLAMISFPLKQFVDALMVSALGDVAIAGQGNGAIVGLVFMAGVMGMLSVINTFASQCLGASRERDAPAYAWNGVWISLIAAALVAGVAPFIGHVFIAMEHTGELLRTETQYARVLLLGAFFPMAARGVAYFFYGVHKPAIVVAAMIVGFTINIGLNYLLIQGRLGFPQLGVVGAGVATVTASACEFSVPFLFFLSPRMNAWLRTRSAWRPSMGRMRELWRVGWPAGLMFANELLCWGIFMAWIIPKLGEAHNTASWIALRYMQLSFMPTVGMQIAVTAVVGRRIGQRDPDGAQHRAVLGVKMGMVYMGVFALAMVLFRQPMIMLFVTDAVDAQRQAEILRIGSTIMILAAVFQVFDALGIILIGALRGAGDTLFPGLAMAGLAWLVLIGGSAVMVALAPGLGSAGPWMMASLYIILVGLVMSRRFSHGAWRSIRVLTPHPAEPDALEADESAMATPAAPTTP